MDFFLIPGGVLLTGQCRKKMFLCIKVIRCLIFFYPFFFYPMQCASVTSRHPQNENTNPSEQSAGLRTFLRFLCLARLSKLPLPCNRGFDVWEEPGVEGGVASGESGSFFNCETKQKEIKKTSRSNFQVNSTNTPLQP